MQLGNWLTREQAKELLTVRGRSKLKGKRAYAILALLVGSALRRRELALLDTGEIQLRENRWMIADLRGKGARIRDLAQIKFRLGHSLIQTTERYLGSEHEIAVAVNDCLAL